MAPPRASESNGNNHGGTTAAERHSEPFRNDMSPAEYLTSRFRTLKPPLKDPPNPWRLIRMLDRTRWASFLVAFAAWVGNPYLPYLI